MKLILTENQYKLLEDIINEISKPMSTKIVKGGFITFNYMKGGVEKTSTIRVDEMYDMDRWLKGSDKTGTYLINVLDALDVNKSTFAFYKNVKYEDFEESGIDETKKGVVSQVIKVIINDSNNTVVDEVFTDLGNKTKIDKEEDNKDKEEKVISRDSEREESIYNIIQNNPSLKRAISHQPSLLNGLLNYGKAKGIGPAKDILRKYFKDSGGLDDVTKIKDKSKFKVGKKVGFRFNNSGVEIKYEEEIFKLTGGDSLYTAKYNAQGILTGREKVNGKIYSFEIKNIKKVKGDIYSGTYVVDFINSGGRTGFVERDQKVTFRITNYDKN